MGRFQRHIRFTTSEDGVSIAFWEIGEGKPVVLIHNWSISHAELEWNVPSIRSFYEAMADRYRLIRFDPRGIGLSGDPPGGWGAETETGAQAGMSVQHQCMDIEAVIRAVDLDTFTLMAVSVQGPVGIGFAATNPNVVSELILYDAVSNVAESHLGPTVEAERAMGVIETEAKGSRRIAFTAWDAVVPQSERSSVSTVNRSSKERIKWTNVQPQLEWNSTALLSELETPTLILCSRTPFHAEPSFQSDARQLASEIADAQMRLVDGVLTPYFFADQEQVLDAIDEFLKPEGTPDLPSGFRTVVFTDIVDSTKFMSEVGDQEGRDAMRAVEQQVSNLANRHQGRVIKNLGDGSLVTFGSNTAALQFALELQSQRDPDSLQLRIGMAAGEPIEEGSDIHGAVVAYASRVADIGRAGEIIASDSVRQLAMGKGFQFSPMGRHDLKGFDEPATVWKVSTPERE